MRQTLIISAEQNRYLLAQGLSAEFRKWRADQHLDRDASDGTLAEEFIALHRRSPLVAPKAIGASTRKSALESGQRASVGVICFDRPGMAVTAYATASYVDGEQVLIELFGVDPQQVIVFAALEMYVLRPALEHPAHFDRRNP